MKISLPKDHGLSSFQWEHLNRARALCKLPPRRIYLCCLNCCDLILEWRIPRSKKCTRELNKLDQMVQDPRLDSEMDLKARRAFITIPRLPSEEHLEAN